MSTEEHDSQLKEPVVKISPDLSDGPLMVGDTKQVPFLKENCVHGILAHHTLTSFKRKEYQEALNNWYRVLKPGGMLHITVPDIIDTVVRFNQGDITDSAEVINTLYGSGDSLSYNGFWYDRLERALKEAKFRKVVLVANNRQPNKTTMYVKAIK